MSRVAGELTRSARTRGRRVGRGRARFTARPAGGGAVVHHARAAASVPPGAAVAGVRRDVAAAGLRALFIEGAAGETAARAEVAVIARGTRRHPTVTRRGVGGRGHIRGGGDVNRARVGRWCGVDGSQVGWRNVHHRARVEGGRVRGRVGVVRRGRRAVTARSACDKRGQQKSEGEDAKQHERGLSHGSAKSNKASRRSARHPGVGAAHHLAAVAVDGVAVREHDAVDVPREDAVDLTTRHAPVAHHDALGPARAR